MGELAEALQMVFVTAHFWIGFEEGVLHQNSVRELFKIWGIKVKYR
jgi:hypothetical protein